jgi:tetratricopeptide (TPR) repeat protein
MALDDSLLATYAHLGDLYVRQGRADEATREFETILSKNPQHVPTLMVLGMLHERKQEFGRAVLRYEEALRLNPRFAPAANNLAWLLIERGENTERALAYAETARQVLPRDPHIADTLGWIYYHKQMYGKSVSLLKEALQQLPEQPALLYHYGMAQYGNSNKEEAKYSLVRFLALSPGDPHAATAKQILAELS